MFLFITLLIHACAFKTITILFSLRSASIESLYQCPSYDFSMVSVRIISYALLLSLVPLSQDYCDVISVIISITWQSNNLPIVVICCHRHSQYTCVSSQLPQSSISLTWARWKYLNTHRIGKGKLCKGIKRPSGRHMSLQRTVTALFII